MAARYATARLLRLWVWIPQAAWMFVCCGCCVLSGRGLCDELIIRPEESYRLWCVVVCDLETWWMRSWPLGAVTLITNKLSVKAYTGIYVNTQQFLFNTTLFCAWWHVSAAHTAIFRPAYNRMGPFYVRTIWDPTLFTIFQYKNTRTKILKCCANIYFNKQ